MYSMHSTTQPDACAIVEFVFTTNFSFPHHTFYLSCLSLLFYFVFCFFVDFSHFFHYLPLYFCFIPAAYCCCCCGDFQIFLNTFVSIYSFSGSGVLCSIQCIRFRLTIPFISWYGVAQQHIYTFSHFIFFFYLSVSVSISISILFIFHPQTVISASFSLSIARLSGNSSSLARTLTFTTFTANNSFENNKISILFAIGSRPTRNLLPVNELRQTLYL